MPMLSTLPPKLPEPPWFSISETWTMAAEPSPAVIPRATFGASGPTTPGNQRPSSDRSLVFQVIGSRVRQRPVRLLVPHEQLLGAVVHPCCHNDSRAGPLRDIDMVRLNRTPVALCRPILGKPFQRVVILLRMLLPVGIVQPDRVSLVVVLRLKRCQKLITRGLA